MKTLDAHPLPVVGERVGRYEVLGPLATGGMGAVFVGRLSGVGGFRKLLALKVLRSELAEDPYFVQMFLDECRIVSQISHRNVVQVFDVVMHRNTPCMVMEFLRGRPLSTLQRALHATGQRVPDPIAACVLEQVAEGLRAAHAAVDAEGAPMHVVHRDVSPDNIQICHDGAVKLVDFGIASSRARSASTRRDAFKGKVAYAAPERIEAPEKVDARADAWSLAVVAWELFAGRRLFDGEGEAGTMWKVIHGPIPSLRDARPDLPSSVADAVMAMLVRPARDRAHDLRAFAAAMSGLASAAEPALARLVSETFDLEQEHDVLLGTIARDLENATAPRRPEPVVADVAPARRRPWLWVAGIVALVGITTVGIQILGARADETPAVPSRDAASEREATPTATAEAARLEPPTDTPAQGEPEHVPGPEGPTTAPATASPGGGDTATAPVPAVPSAKPKRAASRRDASRTKSRRPPKKKPAAEDGNLFDNPYRP